MLQRLGLPDEEVRDGRARRPRPRRRARPPHVAVRRRRRGRRGREVMRLLGLARPAARPRRLPVGRRADPPLAHALPARGGVRGRRGGRGLPATPDGDPAGVRARGRARRPPVPGGVPRGAGRGGRGVRGWPSRPGHPRQARAPPSRTCSATSTPRRSSDVMRNWEQIKKDEKGTTSIVAGITPGLPSLLYAHKLLRKAASVGLDPGDRADAVARIEAAVRTLAAAGDAPDRRRARPAAGRAAGRRGRARPQRWDRRRVGAAGLGGGVPGAVRGAGAHRRRARRRPRHHRRPRPCPPSCSTTALG